jgi:PAS domain S-box-containing protein/putative nucleotidyltransferase with HDIG domain
MAGSADNWGLQDWSIPSELDVRVLAGVISENSGIGIALTDLEGRYLWVNDSGLRILGRTPEELAGRHIREITPEEDYRTEKKLLNDLVSGRVDHYRMLKRFTRGDETRGFASVTRLVMHDERGEPRWLAALVEDISERERLTAEAARNLDSVVDATAALSELRDPYTAGHQQKVAQLSVAIASEMGLDRQGIQGIDTAATLHDIGKIAVPAEILAKPTVLTSSEREIMQGHPRAAFEVLSQVAFSEPVATMILQHHERLDGSGYPDAVHDGEICHGARIIAVADVVEAMSSHRPYREALGLPAALEEVNGHRGRLYDTDVVDACNAVFLERNFEFTRPAS